MTAIPHSGNACSGLCFAPCDHHDCWQCTQYRDNHPELMTPRAKMKVVVPRSAATQFAQQHQSILSQLTAEGPKDKKATITRGALEALAAKAGVRMDWNDGAPLFYDDDVKQTEKAYDSVTGRAIDTKVKELSRLAAQAQNGVLSQRMAQTLAKAAAESVDTMVRDVLRGGVGAVFKADAEANEVEAIQKLRDAGASDADIDAAKSLLGWKPDTSDFVTLDDSVIRWHDSSFGRDVSGLGDALDATINPHWVRTMMQEIARLKQLGVPTTPVFVVHPDRVPAD